MTDSEVEAAWRERPWHVVAVDYRTSVKRREYVEATGRTGGRMGVVPEVRFELTRACAHRGLSCPERVRPRPAVPSSHAIRAHVGGVGEWLVRLGSPLVLPMLLPIRSRSRESFAPVLAQRLRRVV
jgi:hypothetical protein